MSEAGIIEFVLLMAPYPLKLIENFTVFTGPAPMPPIYALGYHQSK